VTSCRGDQTATQPYMTTRRGTSQATATKLNDRHCGERSVGAGAGTSELWGNQTEAKAAPANNATGTAVAEGLSHNQTEAAPASRTSRQVSSTRGAKRTSAETTKHTTAQRKAASHGALAGMAPQWAYNTANPHTSTAPGSTKRLPAIHAPRAPATRHPLHTASCMASGPGNTLHSARPSAKRRASSQPCSSTTTRDNKAV
jgi:hypothetical protein